MWDFVHGEAGRNFDVSYTLPSACAHSLRNGTADIGIIPAAGYAQIPSLRILPDVAIASRRPVRSILLVGKKPIEEVRSVALDTSSMTSVALTKILFEKWLGGGREFAAMDPDLEAMLAQYDAALLIGDPALQVDRSCYQTLDLAEEWIRHTGKPFVFAFWSVRGEAIPETDPALDIASVFLESRNHGLEPSSMERIAREWSPRLGLSEPEIRSYLTESIYYGLDNDCIEGLQLFYRYAAEIGALPSAPELQFLSPVKEAVG
jgi:chorismate dehydratase